MASPKVMNPDQPGKRHLGSYGFAVEKGKQRLSPRPGSLSIVFCCHQKDGTHADKIRRNIWVPGQQRSLPLKVITALYLIYGPIRQRCPNGL